MNLFNEGQSYLGEIAAVTLPKLTRKFEDWRGGGMDGTVKIDMGAEPMELEFTTGGPMRDVLRQYGAVGISAVFLRFSGAYQDDATGSVDTVEVTVRGRHEEIDMGEAKPGEGGEFKVKSALTYYRLDWNGVTEIEIDLLNGVFIVGGVDRSAELRAAVN
jgi:hypothetical protein